MLIDDIKKAKMETFRTKDEVARGILSLVSDRYKLQEIEAKAQGKNLSDENLISIIMKVTKELEEEKAGYLSANNHARVKDIEHQMDVIKRYLPVMMSEADIRKELAALTDRSLPNVMKHFKTNFSGKVDMGLVSKIVKTL
jgi:uncharacterized protein YqeY